MYVFRKSNGKVKPIETMSIKRTMKDCPDIVTKFRTGGYDPEIHSLKFPTYNKKSAKMLLVILDYNRHCKNRKYIKD